MSVPGLPRAPSSGNGYGSHDSQDGKSPLSNFGFLKNLTSEKKQTKDGLPPKRRGPKPDSKPALTRRQELNRQAQRTHRERKEMYIKALEQEVMRLKELFANTTRERDAVNEENRKLKELLAAHGIHYDPSTPSNSFQNMPPYGASSTGSISSYRPDTNSTSFSPPPLRTQSSGSQPPLPMHSQGIPPVPSNRIDYDQVGIDFVLTLERPCMDHMQYLVVRSHNPEQQPFHHPMEAPDDAETEHMCGHALMATCPPASHVMNKPGDPYPHKMPEMQTPDLMKLLDLSARLPLEGEITPVMAWVIVLRSDRMQELDAKDFEWLKTDLISKVRCYGFGAVLEEFEVKDSLSSLFAAKESLPSLAPFAQQQIAAY